MALSDVVALAHDKKTVVPRRYGDDAGSRAAGCCPRVDDDDAGATQHAQQRRATSVPTHSPPPQTPEGAQIQVPIPAGLVEGQIFQFQLPAPVTPQMVNPQMQMASPLLTESKQEVPMAAAQPVGYPPMVAAQPTMAPAVPMAVGQPMSGSQLAMGEARFNPPPTANPTINAGNNYFWQYFPTPEPSWPDAISSIVTPCPMYGETVHFAQPGIPQPTAANQMLCLGLCCGCCMVEVNRRLIEKKIFEFHKAAGDPKAAIGEPYSHSGVCFTTCFCGCNVLAQNYAVMKSFQATQAPFIGEAIGAPDNAEEMER